LADLIREFELPPEKVLMVSCHPDLRVQFDRGCQRFFTLVAVTTCGKSSSPGPNKVGAACFATSAFQNRRIVRGQSNGQCNGAAVVSAGRLCLLPILSRPSFQRKGRQRVESPRHVEQTRVGVNVRGQARVAVPHRRLRRPQRHCRVGANHPGSFLPRLIRNPLTPGSPRVPSGQVSVARGNPPEPIVGRRFARPNLDDSCAP